MSNEGYEIDPDFSGSIFETLGFAPELCPDCHAHMKSTQYGTLICLNACGLKAIRRVISELGAQIEQAKKDKAS